MTTYLTSRDAAERLGIGICRTCELARRKRFPGSRKVLGGWRIPVEDVEHFRATRKNGRPRKAKTNSLNTAY